MDGRHGPGRTFYDTRGTSSYKLYKLRKQHFWPPFSFFFLFFFFTSHWHGVPVMYNYVVSIFFPCHL